MAQAQLAASPGAPGVVAAKPATPLWILSGAKDLLLFVGTPFVILPVVMLAEQKWAASQMYLVVAAFGALGHHLPGMMRAYGDRALFQRFKLRFILGPFVLVGTCAAFAFIDPELYAITLIAYGWGLWHGLMQLFGFLRIYDAKVKSFARITARLDMWMCLSWFIAGVIFSSSRLHFLLEAFYMAGGPEVPSSVIHGIRSVWGTLTVGVTAAYIVNLVYSWRAGIPPNPVKLFALVTGIGFWLYCCLVVRNLLVGILMFELFHDVQYLTIVWLFNRKRALAEPQGVGRFTRSIFGQNQARAILYVGLVMAYGCLYFVEIALGNFHPVSLTDSTPVFGGILAASGLLHFYYDGFIWKMKEAPTRQVLGLEGGQAVERSGGRWWNRSWSSMPGWSEHALNWSPFVAAVFLFLYTNANSAMGNNEARMALGSMFPNYDLAQTNLAMALYTEGDLDGAIEANRKALALDPKDVDMLAQTRNNLGWALVERAEEHVRRGEVTMAQSLLREAIVLDRAYPDAVSNRATELLQQGDAAGAIPKYRVALLMAPGHPGIQMNLALALASAGQLQEALKTAREAQAAHPNDAPLAQLVAQLEQAAH